MRRNFAEKAKMTLEDGVFTLKLGAGISLAMLVAFAQDMFPGISAEEYWRLALTMANSWYRSEVAEQFRRS